jgi:hypothetical protein
VKIQPQWVVTPGKQTNNQTNQFVQLMKKLRCQAMKSDIVGEYTNLIRNLMQVAGKKSHQT